MEEVVNENLPDGEPRKKLKQLYIYRSAKNTDSPEVIHSEKKPEYAVTVDSDFLKRLFKNVNNPALSEIERKEQFSKGLTLLMGVIAHEMGHVIAEGSKHHTRDQATEELADRMGVMLLRKAGLPREGIVELIRFLAKEFPNPNKKIKDKIFSVGVSVPSSRGSSNFSRQNEYYPRRFSSRILSKGRST